MVAPELHIRAEIPVTANAARNRADVKMGQIGTGAGRRQEG